MLNLEIVTPEKRVLNEAVDSVTVPTVNGEIGVFINHAPLISTLKPGVLTYTNRGATEKLVIAGGFVEIGTNSVSILADIAEKSDEIDAESARAEREQSEKILASWNSGSADAFNVEKEKLEKAQARLQLAGK